MLQPARQWSAWSAGIGLALMAGICAAEALPGVVNTERARANYMLNCQGCHRPDGSGSVSADVPSMKNVVGNFLRVPGGREFLIQVPGSANAALSDAELAELLNWMLPVISPAEMPADFEPYTAREVGRLRQHPETDVAGRRAGLTSTMSRLGLRTR